MMTDRRARRLALGLFLSATMVAPAPGLAQRASIGVAERAAQNAARAEALSREAGRLYADASRWHEAASFHLEAAELRAPSDPRAVDDLAMAARLFYHSGRLAIARPTMARAAERALSLGEVVRAANLFLDAANIAKQQGLDDEASQLAGRAEILAGSTLLADKDRAAILRRVAHRESPIADPLL